MARKTKTALQKQIEAASEKVRGFTFNTPEWNAAVETVRSLRDRQWQIENPGPAAPYTSVDGDIFDRR